MKKLFIILIAACSLCFASCNTMKHTRGELYPKMYEEKPVTLLVMPPINNSNNVEAKELLYTSISLPLAEAGYYVISPHLAMEIFKAESAYDAENFFDQSVGMFGRVFGADAVIFSVIDEWKKVGFGIQTKLKFIIKSTRTNEVLFDRTCNLYLDLNDNNYYGGGLVGVLANVAVSAINTALTDHIIAARMCNQFVFEDVGGNKVIRSYAFTKTGVAVRQVNRFVGFRPTDYELSWKGGMTETEVIPMARPQRCRRICGTSLLSAEFLNVLHRFAVALEHIGKILWFDRHRTAHKLRDVITPHKLTMIVGIGTRQFKGLCAISFFVDMGKERTRVLAVIATTAEH